ncbi:MAG: hypothetical protein O7J95_20920 [Planctomycetota bacterium]|nr:hypothetical protein [Planctomycetota bacterium]
MKRAKKDAAGRAPTDDGVPGAPPESDFRELFRRTRPTPRPLDVGLLLAAARRPRGSDPPGLLRVAVALLVVLALGATGGWAAARSESRRALARLEANVAIDLARVRREIVRDVAQALFEAQQNLLEAQEDNVKRVANLLRRDYRTRLARLEAELALAGPLAPSAVAIRHNLFLKER